MSKNSDPNNFTQKEMLIMILDRLDDMDKKVESLLEDKVSRKEFYSVLGVLMTFALIIVALISTNKEILCSCVLYVSMELQSFVGTNFIMELNCIVRRCERGTIVLSDDAKEVH